MERNNIYLMSLILSLPMLLIGAYIKLEGLDYSTIFIPIGVVFTLVYYFIAFKDLFASKSQSLLEKLLWMTGFFTFHWMTGIAYYIFQLRANPT
jgi:hypothetical protein